MSEYLLDVDVVFVEDDLVETAERTTLLPAFNLANYASESMLDENGDRPTLEISEEALTVLVAKSTPPAAGEVVRVSIPYRERVSSARAFVLATPWAAHR